MRSALKQSWRILMTLDAVGGVWRYALDAARGLAADGIQTVLAGFGPRPSEAQEQEIDSLDMPWIWRDEQLDWLARSPEEIAGIPGVLDDLVHRFGADILHLNLPSQAAGLEVDLPVIVVSHSCVATWWRAVRGGTNLPAEWHWLRNANRAGFDRANLVLTPTKSHAEAIVSAYGPINSIAAVANATHGTAPREAKQPFVLSAGRWWDAGKNGAVLEACASAADWPIVAAGPLCGPNGQSIAFSNVRALGQQPSSAVRELMGRAAVFVAPSLYEPFGLAVLEAASTGAALVLADIPSFRELWEDAAVFADPHNPSAFAAAINCLSRNSDLREMLAARAQANARRFTLRRQSRRLLEAYAYAFDRHGHDLASVA
jgi:glycosyltransferase involved in cell wall biosynthesis